MDTPLARVEKKYRLVETLSDQEYTRTEILKLHSSDCERNPRRARNMYVDLTDTMISVYIVQRGGTTRWVGDAHW